jgi:LmbE family N-acetylglucosaminyl deacetylase
MRNLNAILKNWKGNKTLMVIFPHPDDETMASGGLITMAKKYGWRVIAVVLTAGEAGKSSVSLLNTTLSEIRKKELAKAVKILKIDQLITNNFGDGRLKGKEEEYIPWISAQIKRFNPQIIVTFDHSGFSGHPDHISLSLVVKEVIRILPKDSRPWLLWPTMKRKMAQKFVRPDVLPYLSEADYQLNLGFRWFYKWLASKAHKSQSLGKNRLIPYWLFMFFYPYEWYHKPIVDNEYPHKYVPFDI